MKKTLFILLIVIAAAGEAYSQSRPNILILIADDMGTDAFSPYGLGTDLPSTPHLEERMNEGLLFDQAYAYPTCAPSRAAIMTGRYGNKNGIVQSGPGMSVDELTIFEMVDSLSEGEYANALFGKWHLGGNPNRPNNQGIHHYDGTFSSGVTDYYQWERTKNGVVDTVSEYVTTYMTNQAINWVDTVQGPWLLWMAYNAPHGPFHLPPDSLYTRTDTASATDKYLCMIESVDHEAGRLWNSMSSQEQDSTLLIFIGDNGTPNNHLQGYPTGHGKGRVYEGGVRVPLFITGYGVDRIGEIEEGLVGGVDLFATILDMMDFDMTSGYNNSYSLKPVLTDANATTQLYNYSELDDDNGFLQAVRGEQYKLITRTDTLSVITEQFYDLLNDPLEENDLFDTGLSTDQLLIYEELRAESDSIFNSWSCHDLIQNGTEIDIDCGGSSCAPCVSSLQELSAGALFSMYPNPADEYLYIKLQEGLSEISLRDVDGRVILSDMAREVHQMDISSLPNGVYVIHIQNLESGLQGAQRFVKQ